MWQTVLGIIAAAALSALLGMQYLRATARYRRAPHAFFAEARDLIDGPQISPGKTAGSYLMKGTYRGHHVHVQAVTDTLGLRKLPSLWLLVTIPESLPVAATFDLMMRPAGPTTFSNFDRLPETLALPAGFPEEAAIRTDNPHRPIPPHLLAPVMPIFRDRRGKELLISPKGVRVVVQVAEATRARYGVLRQADFGDARLDADILRVILDRMISLRAGILEWRRMAP